MPWSANQASSHTKEADTPKLRRLWAAAANNALKEYNGDEGRAIRVANAAVSREKQHSEKAFGSFLLELLRSTDEPYGDVEYADPGYQKDGKKRYPIDTEGHIRSAWTYIHQADNRGKYSPAHAKEIERRIVAAWKKKIDPEGPPSAGKALLERLLASMLPRRLAG